VIGNWDLLYNYRVYMQKIFSFAFFGIITYIINIWFTYLQVDFWNISSSIAYFFSLIISTCLNLYFSFRHTFKIRYSNTILKKYILTLFCFSAFNYILVRWFTYLFSEEYLYGVIFIITTIIFFLKFFVYDRFIFTSSK